MVLFYFDLSFKGSNVVSPSGNGYDFDWFYSNGTAVTNTGTVTDSNTENPKGLAGDTYKVAVTGNNGCTSDTLTVSLSNAQPLPTATLVEEEPSTGCNIGNGKLLATGDGVITTGFTYEWFLGSNTDAANALPGVTSKIPSSFLVNDRPYNLGGLNPGVYTVRITNTTTGCFTTLTETVTDDKEDPLQVDPDDIIITPQTSCDPANYGGSVDISNAVDGSTAAEIGNENGSFEEPSMQNNPNTGATNPITGNSNFYGFPSTISNPGAGYYSEDLIPGWVTDDPWGVLEIWRTGNNNNPYTAYEGNQWAELNSQFASALYFDVGTVPGTTMIWRFAHRGRASTDCMDLNIGSSLTPLSLVNQGNFCSQTVNTGPNTFNGWKIYEGTYVVPDGQYSTRFEYRSTNGSAPNVGNFIDGVEFFIDPFTFVGEFADGSGTPITDPENDGKFENLAAGTYQFVVKDNYTGCQSDIINVVVGDSTQVPPFAGAAIGSGSTSNTVCDVTNTTGGLFNGTAQINVLDGSPLIDYTFDWYDGAAASGTTNYTENENRYENLPAGTYTVLVTSKLTLCDTLISITIEDKVNVLFTNYDLTPDVSSTDNTDCGGSPNGTITLDVTALDAPPINGSGDYTFKYYVGNSVSGASVDDAVAPYEFTGLAEGNYTVEVVDNVNGCKTLPLTVSITDIPSKPDFSPAALGAGTNNNSVCDASLAGGDFNGKITVNPAIAGSAGEYAYEWFNGAGTLPADLIATATDSVITQIQGGTYSVKITHTAGNGCDTTISVTIQNTDNTIFTDFDLEGDVTTTDDNSCNSDNGTISLSTTALDAISDSDSYTFNLYSGNSAIGATIETVNTAPYSFDQLAPGNYTVEVIDNGSGCTTDPYTVTIGHDPDKPDFSPAALNAGTNNNTVCDDTLPGVSYNGQITVNPNTGAIGDFNYAWFDGAGVTTSHVPASSTNVLSGLKGGLTYTVRITGSNACDTTISVTIADDLSDKPITAAISAGSTKVDLSVCADNAAWPNGSLTASVSGGSSNYEYRWYYGSTVNSAQLLADGNNLATRKGTGSSNALIAGATTANLQNLDPGFYTLQVLDLDRGCLSVKRTFEIIDNTTAVDFTAQVNQHNFGCTLASATGEVEAVENTGGSTYSFEWYKGGSASGTPTATTQIVSNLADGTYTLKVIDNTTSCFYTQTVAVNKITPTLTTTPASVPQSNCDPDGEVSIVAATAFNPAGAPTGYTANDYTFTWYYGNNTSTLLVNGVDPGNGSNPQISVAGNTSSITELAAGNYTVVVTDNASGCISTQKTITVVDGISAQAPTVSMSGLNVDGAPRNTPNACANSDGYIVAEIIPFGGATYTYEWHEGSQDYAGDPSLGNLIVNGAPTNQGALNPQIDPLGVGTPANETHLSNVTSGIYTLVLIDGTTGCRFQKTYDLPFNGQQTTTTLAIKHVESCPDDGEASVGIADDAINRPGKCGRSSR